MALHFSSQMLTRRILILVYSNFQGKPWLAILDKVKKQILRVFKLLGSVQKFFIAIIKIINV